MAYAIKKGSDYFNTITWTADASNGSRSFTGVNFSPDFVWTKGRTLGWNHLLYDSVRGVGAEKELSSQNANAEGAAEAGEYGYVSSLDTDGFTFTDGTDATYPDGNFNYQPQPAYVAWNWKAGGTAVSNTDGTITSSVSANTTSGFSVVSYTGTGNDTDTIGHGLGVTPSLVFWKSRSVTQDWLVTSTLFPDPEKNFLKLNLTNAIASISAAGYTLNSLVIRANTRMASGTTYIAYCFASVEGYSKFGSYTGNGSVDGPFVYTGFRPAFVLVKCTSLAGQGWFLLDSERDSFNIVQDYLMAQSTGAEASIDILDFISNGFKIRQTGAGFNTSAATYIYMAFAENPMKHSLAR